MKKYWYVLLNNELLRYGSQNDSKPRERKNLEGIFVRDYAEPKLFDGHQYYCFYLMFPEKRSIFSFTSREEKDMWVRAIRMANGQVAVEDIYTIGVELGRGKYGKVF